MIMKGTKQLSDKEIIDACLSNDRQAQKALYQKYYSYLMAVCMRYAKDEDEANFIINQAYLKIFSKIDQFQHTGSLKSWMAKITVNTALDHLRKNAKHNRKEEIENIPEPAIQEDVISKLKAKDLLKVIQSLPSMYRTVFNLYALEGFKHKEIAEQLNIKIGTSKWYLSEARKQLKEKLKYYLESSNIDE